MINALYMFIILAFSPVVVMAESYQKIIIPEFGSADSLQLITVAELPEPAANEVRVRVLTASASFTDVMVRKGVYPGAPGELPLVPGYDLVGVVDKLGEGVNGFELGQRVAALTVWGAYTEYAVRPVSELVLVPEGLDDEQAVALILAYTTAYQMLHRAAQVKPGQTILIHGASGAVGTALAQLGEIAGLNMMGTASSRKQGYVSSLGVQAIDYKTEDFLIRAMQSTDNRGVDVAFDAIGVDNFKRSYQALAPSGKLVVYVFYNSAMKSNAGSQGDMIAEFLRWQWQQLQWRFFPDDEKTALFYSITDMRKQHPEWFREDLAALFDLANSGKITPMIWKTLPLSEAAQAHQLIEARAVKGKIVLRVGYQE
jgi:NADPH:quinone reductase-like Zn-dependent oxidoreductase